MYDYFIRKLDQWIENEYRFPDTSLSIFRIVYAGFVLFVVGAPQFRWIADKPEFFFEPPVYSLANLFSHVPDFYFLLALDLLVVLLLSFLLFGYQTKWVSLLLGVVMLVGFSFYHSLGKINHDTLLMLLTPLLMTFSNWGRYYSVDSTSTKSPHPAETHWPVAVLALIIGFAMFSAGVPKLVENGSLLNGWLNTATHAVKGYAIEYHHDDLAGNYLAPFLLVHGSGLLWETLDYTAVFFEIGFLIAVFRQRVFRFFILLAVTFHFVNALLLSISFVNNLALYLLFIDWSRLTAWFRQRRVSRVINRATMIVSTIVLLLACVFNVPISVVEVLHLLSADYLFASTFVMGIAVLFFTLNYFRGLGKVRPKKQLL